MSSHLFFFFSLPHPRVKSYKSLQSSAALYACVSDGNIPFSSDLTCVTLSALRSQTCSREDQVDLCWPRHWHLSFSGLKLACVSKKKKKTGQCSLSKAAADTQWCLFSSAQRWTPGGLGLPQEGKKGDMTAGWWVVESTTFPWCLQVSLFKKIYKYPISNIDKINLAVWNLLWNHQTFGEIPKLSGSNWSWWMLHF